VRLATYVGVSAASEIPFALHHERIGDPMLADGVADSLAYDVCDTDARQVYARELVPN
jgi:hypothetical protein